MKFRAILDLILLIDLSLVLSLKSILNHSFTKHNYFKLFGTDDSIEKLKSSRYVKQTMKDDGAIGLLLFERQLITQPFDDTKNLEKRKKDIEVTLKNQVKLSQAKLGSDLANDYMILNDATVVMEKSKSRSDIIPCIDLRLSEKAIASSDPTGCIVKVKVCKEKSRFIRERNNYKKICGEYGNNRFIKVKEFIDINSGSQDNCYIVMESGEMDLKKFLTTINENAVLLPKQLKKISKSMAETLSVIHSKNMIWTDLKLENFIITSQSYKNQKLLNSLNNKLPSKRPTKSTENLLSQADIKIKAIDLESAVKNGEPLIDFSPETCPPEYAFALRQGQLSVLGGRGGDFKLDLQDPLIAQKAVDIWALGISILQLATGKAPVSEDSNIQLALTNLEKYETGLIDLGLSEVKDVGLSRLLKSMLNIDPSKRPSIRQVLLSLYFITS